MKQLSDAQIINRHIKNKMPEPFIRNCLQAAKITLNDSVVYNCQYLLKYLLDRGADITYNRYEIVCRANSMKNKKLIGLIIDRIKTTNTYLDFAITTLNFIMVERLIEEKVYDPDRRMDYYNLIEDQRYRYEKDQALIYDLIIKTFNITEDEKRKYTEQEEIDFEDFIKMMDSDDPF